MIDNTVAFIITSNEACKTVKKVLRRTGFTHPVFVLSIARALEKAQKLVDGGTRVIVSQGLTYEYLQKRLNVPMLKMPFSGIEAVKTLRLALKHSDRIAHMGTGSLDWYLRKGLELLGLDENLITFCRITEDLSLEEQTQKMIDMGHEVIIGGFPTANYAKQQGKVGLEFDVDEQVVETAVYNARSLARNLIEEEAKSELIRAILHSVSDGIIALDNERQILMANPAASEIVGLPFSLSQGLSLEEAMKKNGVIDALRPLDVPPSGDFKRVVLKEVPVIVDRKTRGSVVSISRAEDIQELESKISKQILLKGLVAKNYFSDIAGESPAITQAKERAQIYARYDSTVLITGETGTGKELFAQSIHNASKRRVQPFVAVNCASLPANLIESELFGYVKGAFTGASKEGKIGLFETAGNGTIFLDEISEIPLSMQAKLLRVLQEREIIRIGSDKVVRVNCRIICSTNKDLLSLVREGKFKEDLYYRLCVLEVVIPPLRERKEDIPPVAFTLLRQFNKRHGKTVVSIEPTVFAQLEKMPFSGNVRELGNILERMVILAEGSVVDTAVMAKSGTSTGISTGVLSEKKKTDRTLKEAQHAIILQALEQVGGNKAAASRLLGIDPSTLWRKLKAIRKENPLFGQPDGEREPKYCEPEDEF